MIDPNKLYEQENYYGKPYEMLVNFFDREESRGRLLDVGCGQGRNSVVLAKIGYEVTGIDLSQTGLDGLKVSADEAGVQVETLCADVYALDDFSEYDVILVDSMLQYLKEDAEKERALVTKILRDLRPGGIFCHCMKKNARGLAYFTDVILDHPDAFSILLDNVAEYPEFNTMCHVFVIKKE